MTTTDEIPADLMLEIGEDLDPKRFLSAAREFFALVEKTSAKNSVFEWRVKVYEGSNILAMLPASSASYEEAKEAVGHFKDNVNALVSGNFALASLSDEALDSARKLSDLSHTKNGIVPMKIWISRKPVTFGPEVGELIREETKPAYWDYGSIEGTLHAIQDRAGNLEIRVRDPLWTRAIKCLIPEEMLEQALHLFRHRVELFGEIHYRKDDTPDNIRVNRLEQLPNDDDLPTIEEVRGLLSGETGAA